MPIDALPSISRSDPDFRVKVDDYFLTRLPAFSTQAEAARVQIVAAEGAATSAASTASSSATTASNAATTATTAAGTATSASASAVAAKNAAEAAAAAAATFDPAAYVPKAGATMTGHLTVPAGASGSQVPRASEVVLKAGGTMSGPLDVPSLNGGQISGLRNRLINGDWSVWRAGTSFGGGAIGVADAWLLPGAAGQTATRVADHPTDGANGWCIEVVNTSGGQWAEQRIPSANCRDLVGKTVTASAYVKGIAVGGSLFVNIETANAQDNFATTTSVGSSVSTTSTSWTRLTFTFTVPAAGANGIRFRVLTSSSGAATARIAACQLEIGGLATPVEKRPYALECMLAGAARPYIPATGGVMDAALGDAFALSVSGNVTLSFSNLPVSAAYECVLEINHTSGTITMPSGTVWVGTAPTLTTGKRHLIFFRRTTIGTAGWYASALAGFAQ